MVMERDDRMEHARIAAVRLYGVGAKRHPAFRTPVSIAFAFPFQHRLQQPCMLSVGIPANLDKGTVERIEMHPFRTGQHGIADNL